MHWVLDVNFREDENQTCERSLVNNLSWLRRFAVDDFRPLAALS
jgi:predicted transposase YbfD/YdcC